MLYFSLLVGKYIPSDSRVWQYYLTLQALVNLLLLKSISTSYIDYIDVLVTEHNELYIDVFEATLKPKMHHMVHYKNCMLSTGPLANNWAMRFESKNHISKLAAEVIKSRVNISRSICIRSNYDFAQNILKLRTMSSFPVIDAIGPAFNEEGLGLKNCYKWVKRLGKKYEEGSVVAVDPSQVSGEGLLPMFAVVKYIVGDDTDVSFLATNLITQELNVHTASYIAISKTVQSFTYYEPAEVSPPLLYALTDDRYHVPNIGF